MSDILEDFYYGKISPWETNMNKMSPDYRENSLEYMSICNALRSSLTEEQLILFNRLLEKGDQIFTMSSLAIFKVGFSSGAKMASAVHNL